MTTTNSVSVLDQLDAADRAAQQADGAKRTKAIADYQDALISGAIMEKPPETIKNWMAQLRITAADIRKDVEDRQKATELERRLAALPSIESTDEAIKAGIARVRHAEVELLQERDRELIAARQEVWQADRFKKQTVASKAALEKEIQSIKSNERAFPND